MRTELKERVRAEVKAHRTRRLLDECVVWVSADGGRKFGVVTEVDPVSGIVRVSSQRWGTQFVRQSLLRPFWGAWS